MSDPLPTVSVLLPAYNAEAHLKEAIQSILDQTYLNFELLVINDGSTDQTREIISSFTDSRIQLIDNPHNLGLITTLNKGLQQAKGTYIARMDADDIALPHRLATQVTFLDSHPGVGLCGSWIRTFGSGHSYVDRLPVHHEQILCRMLFTNPIAHPTVMFRRDILEHHHLAYDPQYPHAEDYAFWVSWSKISTLANIPTVLLYYRIHANQIGATQSTEMRKSSQKIRHTQLATLHNPLTEPEEELFNQLTLGALRHPTLTEIDQLDTIFQKIVAANIQHPVYNTQLLQQELAHHFLALCSQTSQKGLIVWRKYLRSPHHSHLRRTPFNILKQLVFFIKSLLKLERILPF